MKDKLIGNDRWYFICFKCGEKISRVSRFYHEMHHKEKELKKYLEDEENKKRNNGRTA